MGDEISQASPHWSGFFGEVKRLAQVSRQRRLAILAALPRCAYDEDGALTLIGQR